MAESDRRQGQSDGAKGEYNPPDGTGWIDVVVQQVTGQSEADKDYHQGWEEGHKSR